MAHKLATMVFSVLIEYQNQQNDDVLAAIMIFSCISLSTFFYYRTFEQNKQQQVQHQNGQNYQMGGDNFHMTQTPQIQNTQLTPSNQQINRPKLSKPPSFSGNGNLMRQGEYVSHRRALIC